MSAPMQLRCVPVCTQSLFISGSREGVAVSMTSAERTADSKSHALSKATSRSMPQPSSSALTLAAKAGRRTAALPGVRGLASVT